MADTESFIQTIRSRLQIRTRFRRGVHFFEKAAATKGIGLTANARGLLKLHNLHAGKRAFIIGNGPSLRVADLDKLKGEITFAANKIYLCFDQTSWRPTYYFAGDDLVLQQNWEKISSLKGFPKFFPIDARLPRTPNSFYYKNIDEYFSYPNHPRFGTSPIHAFYGGATIVYTMLQMAHYMGCNSAYLIGVDFNFAVPTAPPEGIRLTSQGEVNHFHPDYRKPGEKWNVPNLHYQEKAFEKARSFFAETGRRVYNATRGGKLEIFERVDFDSLFDQTPTAKL